MTICNLFQQSYKADFNEILLRGEEWTEDQPFKFCRQSGSGSGSRVPESINSYTTINHPQNM